MNRFPRARRSNPDSFNAWSESLGLDTSKWSFQDCFGLDPELLAFCPHPVKAVVMLFPVTEAYEKMRLAQDEEVEEEGVADVGDVIYFKQTSKSHATLYQRWQACTLGPRTSWPSPVASAMDGALLSYTGRPKLTSPPPLITRSSCKRVRHVCDAARPGQLRDSLE